MDNANKHLPLDGAWSDDSVTSWGFQIHGAYDMLIYFTLNMCAAYGYAILLMRRIGTQ